MNLNQGGNRPGVSNDIQERTLKVTGIPERVTKNLLFELFLQCGPVRNVVHKPDFAFIEFENEVSVGYSLALMDGVQLFGKKLELQPKITKPDTFAYLQRLKEFEYTFASQPQNWWARFGPSDGRPMPPHLCSSVLNKLDYDVPIVPLPGIYGSTSGLNTSTQSEPNSGYGSRRFGNQSHSHSYNSSSSSSHNQPYHQHQSRSYQSLHPPSSHHHQSSPFITLDHSSQDSSRFNDSFDNRRREENSYRSSENYGQGLRSENEYRRDDEAYYRRRQRDFNDRDGGYHRPDRRTDHSTYERYNPYARSDQHRQHNQSNQLNQAPYYQQPNQNYPLQQTPFQDERRNSFPSYRDRQLPSYRPNARY